MKRSIAAIAMAGVALAACGDPKVKAEPDATVAAADEPAAPTDEAVAEPTAPATPAAPGAPAFAALYPGAEPSAPAVVADGPEGAGGMVEFSTAATPDAVIDFYKRRAEGAGLTPTSAMDQGETRAYSAAKMDTGARVQVVAIPVEDGPTAVTLTWTAGR